MSPFMLIVFFVILVIMLLMEFRGFPTSKYRCVGRVKRVLFFMQHGY